MKIYLVQHGDAVPKDIDPDRPLSQKGRQDVEHVAVFLQSAGVKVAQLMHSGKTRARQTAEILSEAVLHEGEPAIIGDISPNDPVVPFARRLAQFPADTMVVGHLPFMGKLVSHLLTKDEARAAIGYVPATMVCLERNDGDDWSMAWMVRPELLQRKW